MLSGRSIQIARIFGIRIGVDTSWFLIVFFLIWWLSDSYRNVFPGQEGKAFVLATISVLLLFVSIILHELGHAVVAMRNGIGIAGIDLWMLGGIAQMKKESPTPGVDFRISAAGPAVSLAIALICGAILKVGASSGEFGKTLGLASGADHNAARLVLGYVATTNAVIFVFNLIPGLPLDGGRIARAVAWWRTGDRAEATKIAANLGRGVSYLLAGLAIFFLLGGHFGNFQPTFGGSLTLLLVALFIGQSARAAMYQEAVADRLRGITVADVMDRQPVSMPGETRVDRALDDFFLRYRWPWFPVVDATGRFLGLVSREGVDEVPDALREGSSVSQVMVADSERTYRIGVDEPLESLLASEGLQRLGAIMAVDDDGKLRGVVTLDQVRRALQTPTPAV
ncbi:MAG: site-2 protease family protein [Thermoleophilaceae bacterium]|jgi:Zn-dependent protease